mmetsp:Transcript_11916/g.33992  ORF Transcript_11916/g.33992 Transcript_11916/m.33992 type:complete len:414 (-) Transcript_11916:75-1316(-)
MVRVLAVAVAAATVARGLAAAHKAEPAEAKQIDAVHQTLEKLEHMHMTAEQKRFTDRTVTDVEGMLGELEKDTKLTKAQRQSKVKAAIDKMQGLQSQWELSSVEAALHKVLATPGASPKLLAEAKKVVGDVDAVVEDLEAGKLQDPAARQAKVGAAIQALTGLEQEWAKAAGAGGKLQQLEQQLAEKKALLAKTEKEMKLVKLEKELAEKKQMLERLVANKHAQEAQQKQREEDDAQQQMVAQLVAAARSAAAASPKAPAAPIKAAPATAEAKPKAQTVADAPAKASKTTPKEQAIAAILENMKVQAKNVSDSIAAMDANEKKRQAELQHNFQAPTTGKKDAIAKGQAMLKLLAKKEHRNYEKARALRESELKDLNEGMRSVEKGDVQALTKLMGKMQKESKNLQAKSKNFLY